MYRKLYYFILLISIYYSMNYSFANTSSIMQNSSHSFYSQLTLEYFSKDMGQCKSKQDYVFKFNKLKEEVLNKARHLKALEHPCLPKILDYKIFQILNSNTGIFNKYLLFTYQKLPEDEWEILANNLDNEFQEIDIYKKVQKVYHQIKGILQVMDSEGITHRKITANDILINKRTDQIKLLKIGICVELQNSQIEQQFGRESFYQSPQKIKQGMYCQKSDLWALGVLLCQIVVGRRQIRNQWKCPAENPKKFKQYLQRKKIPTKIKLLIDPILTEDQLKRQFYNNVGYSQYSQSINFSSFQLNDRKFQILLKENNIKQLKQISLSNCDLSDKSALSIKSFLMLQKLNISGNQLSDSFINYLDKVIYNLQTLNMCFTNITDKSIIALTSRQSKLLQIDVSYTKITSSGILLLTKMVNLKSFYLWSSNYDCQDYYPARYYNYIHNGNLKNYTKYLQNKIQIDSNSLEAICNKLTKLTSLTINSANSNMINAFIEKTGEQIVTLQTSAIINPKQVSYLINLKKLQRLYLKDITGVIFEQFSSMQLISLSLVSCKVNLKKLISSLAKCPKLENLILSNMCVNNRYFVQISKKLSKLKYLDLASSQIDNEGIISACNNLLQLHYLNLQQNIITEEGAKFLITRLSNLIMLNLKHNRINIQHNKTLRQHFKGMSLQL